MNAQGDKSKRGELTWMIGGPQGSGINVSAETFSRSLSRGGLHVFANIEYHSNIMGKHSFFRIRASQSPIHSYVTSLHILAAVDKETLFGDAYKEAYPSHSGHVGEVAPNGAVLYDAELGIDPTKFERKDLSLYPVPYMKVLEEALADLGKGGQASHYLIMKNTVILGASVAISDYDFDTFAKVFREEFEQKKKPEIGQMNVVIARKAYDYVRSNFGNTFAYKISTVPNSPRRILTNGTKLIAIAKLKAGCAFQTYYPISPATDESVFLENQQRKYQINVVQCEDEISCINMAVGAAHAGVRASTSTSGPGLALMCEGVGLAGITECPGPVIFLYQRGGPSTGLPTRQEQGDLRFALHCAPGDFPHVVFASGDVIEAFYDSSEAFNLAEHYQMPVILLVDKQLAHTFVTVDPKEFDQSKLKVDRGLIYDSSKNAGKPYLRYELTESGISPRAIPGMEGAIYWMTSDEHTPQGHITEGIKLRNAMMEKRMKKLELVSREIPRDRKYLRFGPKNAELTVVSWGSNKGTLIDALETLNAKRDRVNFIHVRLMRPFPKELSDELASCKRTVIVENNYSASLAGLIREHTGRTIDARIVKYDGRPYAQDSLTDAIEQVLRGQKEVVVSHG